MNFQFWIIWAASSMLLNYVSFEGCFLVFSRAFFLYCSVRTKKLIYVYKSEYTFLGQNTLTFWVFGCECKSIKAAWGVFCYIYFVPSSILFYLMFAGKICRKGYCENDPAQCFTLTSFFVSARAMFQFNKFLFWRAIIFRETAYWVVST